MVFVRLGQPNIVVPLATSTMDDGPAHYYTDDTGKEHHGLTAKELVQVVKKHLLPAIRRSRCTKPSLIIDQHSAHKSLLFREFCRSSGINLVLLPPHSPDLSPLDCHLFGAVRHQHEQKWTLGRGAWKERSKGLIKLLEMQDSKPHIMAWQRQLEAVLFNQGCRIVD
jgi:hypothetical protein